VSKKSTDYLIESTFNINEIAHKVGFLDVNHFIHSFKKRYGKSPKRYQLEYLKINQKI
jgi:AraC-like DNA-binding protein